MAIIYSGNSYKYEIALDGSIFQEINIKTIDISPETGTDEWVPANGGGFKRKLVTSKGFTITCEVVMDYKNTTCQELITLIFASNIEKHNDLKLKISAPLEEGQTSPVSYTYSGSIEPTGGPQVDMEKADTIKFNFLVDGKPTFEAGA